VRAIDKLSELSEKAAPGRPPAYSDAHVLMALERLSSSEGVGRQQLSRELGLGEGTARTLVDRLKGEGLIDTSRRGMSLTPLGLEVLGEAHGALRGASLPETEITVGYANYAVLVRGGRDLVRLGVEQRDAALLAGAKGATTLVWDGVELRMPGADSEIEPQLEDLIVRELGPEEGDVIVIGTAETGLGAEVGAKSAALELLGQMGQRSSSPGQSLS